MILNNDFIKVWHGICTIPNVGRQEQKLVALFRLILNSKLSKVWHGICTIPNVGRQEQKRDR